MNVTYVYADKPHEWNSAEWRAAVPARAINRTKRSRAKLIGIEEFTHNGPQAQFASEDADVIVLQRGAMPETFDTVRYWQRRGVVVLADLDDGYPQITAEHPAYNFWHRGIIQGQDGRLTQLPRSPLYDMADGLKLVDGLIAPNKLILSDWAESHQIKGAYVPNYAEAARYRAVERTRAPEDDGVFWVGWGGSFGHFVSFQHSGIVQALSRVLASRPHVRLVLCGADPRPFDSIPLRAGQKIQIGWQPNDLWLRTLVNFDVGIIPCAGEFDARRSWLKPLEHAMLGVPWISSRTAAYEGLDDCGVFVENTPDAWAKALAEAIDSGTDKKRVARAREWAYRQDIDRNVGKIIDALKGFRK